MFRATRILNAELINPYKYLSKLEKYLKIY